MLEGIVRSKRIGRAGADGLWNWTSSTVAASAQAAAPAMPQSRQAARFRDAVAGAG
jgi:hypothetical protein